MKTIIGALIVVLGAAPFATAARLAHRQARQEKRIEHGVANGKLSPAEAARLQEKSAAIAKEKQAMKDANGGHLTRGQRQMLNRQENRSSRQIYRQKHDHNDK